LENSELTGMLIKNMDYKVYHPGNNFYEALVSNEFFQKTLTESRESRKHASLNTLTTFRPQTTSTNMKINLSPETIFQPSSRALSNLSSTRTTTRQYKSLSNIPERNV